MILIVGLGNPGTKYAMTRHNMGFRVADAFSSDTGIEVNKEVFNGILGRGKIYGEDILIFKPTTYMNLSGTAVQQVVHYFKIPVENIIVCYDDLALPPGSMRMRLFGSSGGQKGMQNIIECLGTDKIKRIRIGIGEPIDDTIDYVLGKPLKEDEPLIKEAIDRAVIAIKEAIKTDFEKSMSKYN